MSASIWFPGYTPQPIPYGYVPHSAEEFGAKGDGVTDDSSALQKGLDQGYVVWLQAGKTYVASNLMTRGSTSVSGLVCLGGRAKIKVPEGEGNFGIKIQNSNVLIDGVDFDGGDYGPWNNVVYDNTGTRTGISIGNSFGTGLNLNNITVQNCQISGFDYCGLYGQEIVVGYSFGKRCTLFNVNANRNNINFWASPRFEYVTATSCYGYEGFAGVIQIAGNCTWVACHFERNTENCQMSSGDNNSHGQFIGCSFNHGISYGLHAVGVQYGELFVGCAFWYAPIWLDTCTGIKITQSQIVNSAIRITAGGLNCIDDNWTQTPLVKTFEGFTFTTFRRNRTNSTDTDLSSTYGDSLLECKAVSLAYPIAFNATSPTELTLVSDLQKYNGETATFLISGGRFYVTRSGRYQIDARIIFTTLGVAEKPILTITRYTGAVAVESHTDSREYTAGQNYCCVAVNIRMNAVNGDTIALSLSTRSATGITIPNTGIMFRACSID